MSTGSLMPPEFLYFPRPWSSVFLTFSSLLLFTLPTALPSSLLSAHEQMFRNAKQLWELLLSPMISTNLPNLGLHAPHSHLGRGCFLQPMQPWVLSHLLQDAKTPASAPSSQRIISVLYWIIPSSRIQSLLFLSLQQQKPALNPNCPTSYQ